MVVKRAALAIVIATALLDISRTVQGASAGDWLQWGGANRNFMPDATDD